MNSINLRPQMLAQLSSFLQEQDEIMVFNMDMNMHARFLWNQTSQCKDKHMHAWILTQINMWSYFMTQSTKFDMNHVRTSSIHKQEGVYTTLGLELEVWRLNVASLLQFLLISKQFSPPLSLGRLRQGIRLMKCFVQV